MNDKFEWEVLERHDSGRTERVRVPGGWLYRTIEWNPYVETGDTSVALVFVPEVK